MEAMEEEKTVIDPVLEEELKRANDLIADGNMAAAVMKLETILRRYPDSSDGYAMLTSLYLALERTDIRKEWVLKAIKNTPALAHTFLELSIRLYEEGRFKECNNILEALIWADPDNYEAWNDLGAARFALGDLVTAEKAFNQSLALNRNYGESIMNLAALYMVTQRESMAVHTAMDAMERECEVPPEIVKEMAALIRPVAPEEAERLLLMI